MNFSKRSSTWERPSRTVMPLARSSCHAPRGIEPQRGQAQCRPVAAALGREITLCDLGLGALRPGQLRESRWEAADARRKESSLGVDEPVRPPSGGGHLLHYEHRQPARPVALDADAHPPRAACGSPGSPPPDRTVSRPWPRTCRATICSMSAGATCWNRPVTSTVRIGWSSAQKTTASVATTAPPAASTRPMTPPVAAAAGAAVARALILLRCAGAHEHRSATAAPATNKARLEHSPHELVEVDAGRARGHGHQAVAGHAGNGVDLEQQRARRRHPS